jgi:hypothetical protein
VTSADGIHTPNADIRREPDDGVGRHARRPHRAVAHEITITSDETPLIPEGIYDAVGGDARVLSIFGKKKLAVTFIVMVPDAEHPNGARHIPLVRHFNVTVGPGGGYRAGNHSAYRREWITVTGRRPARRCPLGPSVFKNVLVRVEVHTVAKDSQQRLLPPAARYSVVSRIIEVKAGGGPQHA